MNNTERYIIYAILLGVILYLVFWPKPFPEPNKVTVTLQYDSIPKIINNSTIERPVVFKPGEINIPPTQLNILQSTDTGLLKQVLHEVLSRYYEERVQHTTTVDSNIVIDTWDTITENAIYGRKLQYKWLQPMAQTTTITNPERFRGYLGVGLEAGATGLNYVGPQLYFTTKKGTLLEVGYNGYYLITGQDKFSFKIGAAQKISFRKK